MSATSAWVARSSFVQPFRAMSSAMSWASKRTGVAGVVCTADQIMEGLVFVVNHKIQPLSTKATSGPLECAQVAKRPVFLPEMGAFFVQIREAKGWGQRQAAELAQRRGLRALTRQVLLRLESGRTKYPDPEVLRAIAALYEIPYEILISQFVEARYNLRAENLVDLLRHGAGYQSASSEGGADVSASSAAAARILELERTNADLETTLGEVRDLTRKLFAVAVRSAEDRASSAPEARRSKDARGARR